MKVYILVGIYTSNDLGATGDICDFLLFDSKEKATERLQQEIEGNTESSVTIKEINVTDEQGRIISECDYTADWTGDYYHYEIREIDTEEIGWLRNKVNKGE